MNKVHLLIAFAFTLASCDNLAKPASLKGNYRALNPKQNLLPKFELTDSKFIMDSFTGESATDYTVEDGYLYAGPKGAQIRFKIISSDTLSNEGTFFEGTFVKVRQ